MRYFIRQCGVTLCCAGEMKGSAQVAIEFVVAHIGGVYARRTTKPAGRQITSRKYYSNQTTPYAGGRGMLFYTQGASCGLAVAGRYARNEIPAVVPQSAEVFA